MKKSKKAVNPMPKEGCKPIPASMEQARAFDAIRKNHILFVLGPAGSGKTFCAMQIAVDAILNKTTEKIILSRPVVPAGEELGFLPGSLEKKMLPWLLPIHDVLSNISHTKPEEFLKTHAEIAPIPYMRGRTFSKCVAVLDEAQNCKYGQLKLFLTRIGKGSKLIVTGDSEQCDIVDSGLSRIVENLRSLPGVAIIELPHGTSPRHPLLPELLARL